MKIRNNETNKLLINDKPITSVQPVISLDLDLETESPDWKEKMKKAKFWSITFEGVQQNEAYMTYYCHKGNKYFFRNSGGELIMEIDEELPVKLKYGREYGMKFIFS